MLYFALLGLESPICIVQNGVHMVNIYETEGRQVEILE